MSNTATSRVGISNAVALIERTVNRSDIYLGAVVDTLDTNGYEVRGDRCYGNGDHNIWFWFAGSDFLCDVLDHGRKADVFHLGPIDLFSVAYDGGAIFKVPLATSGRKYKQPHWLPVAVHGGAGPECRYCGGTP